MLSAFTARPIIELKQRDKSKIEAILAHGIAPLETSLSSRRPLTIVPLLPANPGDRVLVGLNTGSLRIYRLNNVSLQDSPPTNGTQGQAENGTLTQPEGVPSSSARPASIKPTDLLREVDKFSSRAVEQLAIIKEANTLVSLSAYHISLHDLGSYELIETLQRTKNATCFAVTSNIVKDAATGIPEIISRLAVAVKRRLILWRWHAGELNDDVAEIVLPEAIRTITWATATTMVCGMNAGYVLIDVETSAVTEIAGTTAPTGQASRFGAASMGYMGLGGYMPKPLAARLTEGEMLLAKDINTLFIDAKGKPLDKRQIPWQVAPDYIGYSYPYIVALQPPAKGALEVRNPDTLSLLQNISLPGAAQMHFPPPTVSLVHAAKGFLVSSERCVWKMDADDYDAQVSELIQQTKYDEAISVLNMLEAALLKDKAETLREVKMRKAETLFRAKRYRDSMDLFNEDEVHAPPERVLRLFPPVIAQHLSADAGREDETASLGENEDQEEQPSSEEGKTNGDKNAEDLAEVASPVRPGAFAKYWPMGGGHKKIEADAASIASSKKGHKDDDAASIKASQATQTTKSSHDNRPLEGDDLKDALRALSMYLVGTRTRLGRVIDHSTGKLIRQPSTTTHSSSTSSEDPVTSLLSDTPNTKSDQELEESLRETLCLVDTTLFRAYIHSTPTLTGSLFRLPNFCDPEVVNEKLLQSHRYSELVEFFRGKKLHREALTLLRRFGTAMEAEPNGGAPDSPAPDDMQFDEKRASSQEHHGHDEDAVATKLDDTMAIPINPSEIPDQLRTPQRTVVYLQYLPPSLIDLILEFSEWVLRRDPDLGMDIFLADTENAETLPRARVAQFLGDIDEKLEIRYLEHVISELNDATPDFHNRLVELFVQVLNDETDNGAHDDDSTASAGDTRKPSMMERLVKFLRESRQYSLSRAYAIIPRDGEFLAT